ncbi:MAG TPA: 30S ribosomal protein S2 [Candidatus Methylomirabilis sp.]|nr:30S ribosomal protein S2 [Candidatus Methylomirabilis sp.]
MPPIPSLIDLLQAGSHFGHQTSKWHPKMKKYIFGERQGIHIINLEETQKALEKACAYARQTTARGGVILFVGTKKQASDIVAKAAASAAMPFVNKRWLGGTLTNYVNLAQLLRKYKDLKRKLEKGELGKYTKFEQQKFAEMVENYDDKIGGLAELARIPDAVFILDIRKDKTALEEAQRRGVKVIAVVDTNVNPTGIEYPIPANDDAAKSIELITSLIAAAAKEGRDEWEKARARLGGSLVANGAPVIERVA